MTGLLALMSTTMGSMLLVLAWFMVALLFGVVCDDHTDRGRYIFLKFSPLGIFYWPVRLVVYLFQRADRLEEQREKDYQEVLTMIGWKHTLPTEIQQLQEELSVAQLLEDN